MNIKRWSIMHFLQFGLYFFLFLLTESVVNEKTVVTGEIAWVNYAYGIGLLFTALGYFLYPVIKRITRRTYMVLAAAISIVAALGMVLATSFWCFISLAYIFLLAFGYIGGYVHDDLAKNVFDNSFSLKIGVATATAIVCQFLVQNVFETNLLLTVVIISIFIVIMAIINWLIGKYTGTVGIEYHEDDQRVNNLNCGYSVDSIGTRVIVYAVVVAMMSCILAFQDSMLVARNAAGEVQLFSFVRLFYALGLLVAGFIANLKKRVYLPLAAGCSMILSVLAISFMGSGSASYNFSMIVMYFYCGFYVIFLTIVYMELGQIKGEAALYSGMGRIVRSITTSVVVMLTTVLDRFISPDAYAVLSCLMCVGIIVIMALTGVLIPEKVVISEVNVPKANDSFENKIIDFSSRYGFTAKEQEAFALLMTTEKGVQEIADEMMISRRVLQRHISSIYDKTGTKTRVGLIMLLKDF